MIGLKIWITLHLLDLTSDFEKIFHVKSPVVQSKGPTQFLHQKRSEEMQTSVRPTSTEYLFRNASKSSK